MMKNLLALVGACFIVYHGTRLYHQVVQKEANKKADSRADARFDALKEAWMREKEEFSRRQAEGDQEA